MSRLFSPLTIRGETFKNRVFISPMCMYSAIDGLPNDWHMVHLGSFAVGGAGLVMVEATAVSPEGRISPADTGLWNDTQLEAFKRVTAFIRSQDSVPAIQLAHAGRKASTSASWDGGKLLLPTQGGWETVAPSAVPFSPGSTIPRALDEADIDLVITNFENATKRALEAGFGVIEIHMAHGYLLHQFLSPLSNFRTDQYGGSFENRIRFPLTLAQRVRKIWPESKPLFVRISATDWVDGGWDLEQSIEFSRSLAKEGIDLIDCSSGGSSPKASIPVGPGYQVPLAAAIRQNAGVKTGAVGLITEPEQAEKILVDEQADVVFIAREALRKPHWPHEAARKLKADIVWPKQYERAKLPF